jgi:hypothetical protein
MKENLNPYAISLMQFDQAADRLKLDPGALSQAAAGRFRPHADG